LDLIPSVSAFSALLGVLCVEKVSIRLAVISSPLRRAGKPRGDRRRRV